MSLNGTVIFTMLYLHVHAIAIYVSNQLHCSQYNTCVYGCKAVIHAPHIEKPSTVAISRIIYSHIPFCLQYYVGTESGMSAASSHSMEATI